MLNTVPRPDAEPATILQNAAPSHDWLEELALNLAQNLEPVSRSKNNLLPGRLKILGTFLQSAYRYFAESSQEVTAVSHAAEWMLDNFYNIESWS